MNKTPIHKIFEKDDIGERLDRLERLLTKLMTTQASPVNRAAYTTPSVYTPSNVIKSQADCIQCATRASLTEKVLYFALGGVLTLILAMAVKNMKNNQQRRSRY